MRRPFIPLTAAFSGGILTGNWLSVPDLYVQAFLIVSLAGVYAAFRRGRRGATAALLMTSLFAAGLLGISACYHSGPGPTGLPPESVNVTGVICENPDVAPERTLLVLSSVRISSEQKIFSPLPGKLLLTVNGTALPYRYGDFIRFRARLRAPHNFLNPGGIDYAGRLLYRGITIRAYVNSASGIALVRSNQANSLRQGIEDYRSRLRDLVRNHTTVPEGQIIQAMILGEQNEIPDAVRENFNRTGTSHIIAISGFNVGIIVIMCLFAFRTVLKLFPQLLLQSNAVTLATILSVVPVVFFAAIAGMGVSVVRAAIMAVLFMAALTLGRERDLANILALAAFIILVFSPGSLFDVSFQLSFVAVASILFLVPRLVLLVPERYRARGGFLHTLVLFFATTISATLGTMPLLILYFHRFSTVVLPANLAVVPILGILAIPCCMAVVFAAPISTALAVFFIKVSSMLATVSIWLVNFFAHLPGAALFVPTPNGWEITLYYAALTSLGIIADKRRTADGPGKFSLAVLIAVLAVSLIGETTWLVRRSMEARTLRVTAIDVGQGSATLIGFPDGRSMLVDGGGFAGSRFDIGKHVLAPFLFHERIRTLDYVVLTHPHPDHMNGLLSILDNFPVGEFWSTEQTAEGDEYERLCRLVAERKIRHRIAGAQPGDIRIGKAAVAIVAGPASPAAHHPIGMNDGSLVMKITYGKVGILLPADITERSEAALLRTPVNLQSRVLFAPHHGGNRSSSDDFLARVAPDLAVISCGADNVYGTPRPELLARYAAYGIRIFRTDRDGAVTIMTDGNVISVRTYRDARGAGSVLPSPGGYRRGSYTP